MFVCIYTSNSTGGQEAREKKERGKEMGFKSLLLCFFHSLSLSFLLFLWMLKSLMVGCSCRAQMAAPDHRGSVCTH